MEKYERQGRKAFAERKDRDSCRYKAADIRKSWMAGFDAEEAKAEQAEVRANRVRWVGYGGRSWAKPPTPPISYHLRGDAPSVVVHGQSYEPGAWFVSVHEWGVDSVRLDATEAEAAAREALIVVAGIARDRLAVLDRIADESGVLRKDGGGDGC